ncbi:MAG: hypothetical protein JNJ45_06790 [Chthonomonas sp.]|nr:hypothetical protein [Chthonomonas sp.]
MVVVRFGDGAAAPTTASSAVFLDEYTPLGLPVQSIALPASGANRHTNTGTSTSEGQLYMNENKFSLMGYDLDAGAASPGTTSNLTTDADPVERVVSIINLAGTVDSSTRLVNIFSGNAARAAIVSGTKVYVGGSGGSTANGALRGTILATIGSPTTTAADVINTEITNIRTLQIFNGQLYMSCGSGVPFHGVNSVGTGTPTAAATLTNLANTGSGGNPVNGSPYDFEIVGNTMFVADDRTSGGILKYTFSSGVWSFDSTLTVAAGVGARAIAKASSGYFVTGTDNQIYSFDGVSSFASIVAGAANTNLRGIGVVPGSVGGSISGTVNLGSYVGTASGSASVTLNYQITDLSDNVLSSGTVSVTPSGGVAPYSISAGSATGSVKVKLSGGTWLKRSATTTVGAVNANMTLPNGNVALDGSFELIDVADYSGLAAAFDGVEGDGTYAARADLNKDGIVDIADYTILAGSFDLTDE